ncbi:hypothetical protein RND81_06G167300 [Saponaria officinalis]|uniref:Uncharacterized protein n=1 Tax=Saponaria officinalis TaxID=3572 RepID=A0AAW1K767_SAPOF
MASQLTQTLTLKKLSSIIPKLSSLSFTHLFSHKSNLIEFDLHTSSSSSSASDIVVGIQHLEEVIHSIIVRRLEPDWLAFRPGFSYWVPPSRTFADNLAKLVGRMSNRLNDEESLSLVSARGWPSSSFFIDQVSGSTPVLYMHVWPQNSENAPLAEDEE